MRSHRLTRFAVAATLATTLLGAATADALSPVQPAYTCQFTKPLFFGQNDPQVRMLKVFLSTAASDTGIVLGPPDNGVSYNNHYGWRTRNAVKQMQRYARRHHLSGLPVTGNINGGWLTFLCNI